jgi:hypothetical protein
MKLNIMDLVALILLVIGGLNWGLVGLFSFDLVASLFGAASVISNIVYILVGVSAVYVAFVMMKLERR